MAADEIDGFPKSFPGRSLAKGVSLGDLDRDGKMEIVAVTGEGFAILDGKGTVRPGYPKVLKEATDKAKNNFDNAPTLCDVDGDGRTDIVLAGSNRFLYAVRPDGGYLSGYPVKLDGEPKGAVACSPVRGTKAHDLVLVTATGTLTRVSYRGGAAQRVAKIGEGAESGVAVSDFDGDGKMDFVAVGGDARVYVVNSSGAVDPAVDYRMAYRVSGTPSLGDINDDGRPDIVLASQDFKVHAVGLDGKPLKGFPVATNYRLYGGPALADVDRDGVLDVVFGSGDKKVYAVNGEGRALKGFPVKVESRVSAEVAVGDLDFDGLPEIAVTTERARLHVFNNRGKALKGFPRQLGGAKTVTAPAMGDIDGDGAPELVVQDGGGNIRAYAFQKKGKAERAVVDWGMSGHDAAGSGRFGPNPGRYKDLTFAAETVYTSDPIAAKYTFFDLDGDSEGQTRIRWYRDGKRVPELDDKKSVPPASTGKHQRWKYTVQADENFRSYGEDGTLSRIFKSTDLEVANTPPTAPKVNLGPNGARTRDALTVSLATPSTDVDGDRIEYRYAWIRDGAPVKALLGKTSVPSAQTKKGEVWRVVVAPFDGEEEGASHNAVLTVLNTVPSAPVVAWNVTAPKVDDTVTVIVKKPAVDVDGDPVTYRYRYRVGAETLPLPVSSSTVPPRTLHKHDELEVTVTAWDDEGAGGVTTQKLKVVNTPPVPPRHAIWPAKPKTTDPLAVGVREQAADAVEKPLVIQGDRVSIGVCGLLTDSNR
ncbi:MAG: FG-GAP-like repeat-containing protein, partial [Myxococcota bacterium]